MKKEKWGKASHKRRKLLVAAVVNLNFDWIKVSLGGN